MVERDRQQLPKYSELFTKIVNRNTFIILMIVLVLVLVGLTQARVQTAEESLAREAEKYDAQVTQWINRQENVLNMFVQSIEAQDGIWEEYDKLVTYLNDITEQYSEVSCTYLADPSLKPIVIMNNGWLPRKDLTLRQETGIRWRSIMMILRSQNLILMNRRDSIVSHSVRESYMRARQ